GRHAGGAEVVLQRHGDAGQRAGVAPRRHDGVDLVGAGEGLLGGDEVEGVDLPVAGLDGGEVLLDDSAGGAGAAADGGGDLDGGAHGASPSTGGTRNMPSSTAGAASSTASRTPASRATSGRITLARGNGWAVGGTSSSSRASTSAACSRIAASCGVNVSSCSSESSRRASRATWATSSREIEAMGGPWYGSAPGGSEAGLGARQPGKRNSPRLTYRLPVGSSWLWTRCTAAAVQ